MGSNRAGGARVWGQTEGVAQAIVAGSLFLIASLGPAYLC